MNSTATNPAATRLVATLIAAPAARLDATLIDRARALLGATDQAHWLAEGMAADLPFAGGDGDDKRGIADRLRNVLGGQPIDVIVQAQAGRRKKLLLADMDSTIIGQECIDELADFVGLKAHVAAITERAMRGEIEFAPALRERVALLKGLPVTVVADVLANRITLNPGATMLTATMRAHGAYTCLVSGGFTLFTGDVARRAGFNEDRANRLIVADGHFAGAVEEPILGREAKLETLVNLRAQFNIAHDETLVIGDGANDLGMIGDAGLGVAYHAKPAVAAAAHARIDHGDLATLLYAQGYHRDEFASR